MLESFIQHLPQGWAWPVAFALAWLLWKILSKFVVPTVWEKTNNSGLVTQEDCANCDKRHAEEIAQGNELFRLLLEGHSIHTQALIALCNEDKNCRELKTKLEEHVMKLASRKIGR